MSRCSSQWAPHLFIVDKTVFVNAVKEGEGKYRRSRITRYEVRGPRLHKVWVRILGYLRRAC